MNSQQIRQLSPRIESSYAIAAQLLSAARDALQTSEVRGDCSDKAKAMNEHRILVESLVNSHERIERIKAARNRMSAGTFGICVDCGEDIAETRLRVLPWAERCVTCEAAEERRRACGGA